MLAVPLAVEIGRQNAAATLAALQAYGVQVAGSSTGGTMGRTVRFFPETGILEVRPVGGAVIRL